MVLTSGLVSLNVHDSLTFDGTEICLHPDLFGSAHNNNAGASSTTGDGNASFQSGGTTMTARGTARLSVVTPANSNAPQSSALIQAGDMIEVRVWDPLPYHKRTTKSVGTTGSGDQSRSSPPFGKRQARTSPPAHAQAAPLSTTQSVVSNSAMSGSGGTATPLGPPSLEAPLATGKATVEPAAQVVGDGGDVAAQDHATKATLEAAASSLQQQSTTGRLRQDLLQYSDSAAQGSSTVKEDVDDNVKEEDGKTVADGDDKSIVASDDRSAAQRSSEQQAASSPPPPSGIKSPLSDHDAPTPQAGTRSHAELPPVFPRPRTATEGSVLPAKTSVITTTTAAGPLPTNTATIPSTNKPPTLTNRRTSVDTAKSSLAAGAAAARPPPVKQFRAQHSRDMSDMTLETVYDRPPPPAATANTATLDASHQLVDWQLPLSSQGEGDSRASTAAGDPLDDDTTTAAGGVGGGGGRAAAHHATTPSWSKLSQTHSLRLSFVMLVSEKSLNSLKSSARTQVSLLRNVADLYELSSYDMVTVHKIDPAEEATVLQAVSADFMLVTIKDQFISRGDMHFFQQSLRGTWVYEGQRILDPARGVQAHAREIRHGDHRARSGIITADTMITYRSRSARIFWLVQLSAEMWDYASPYERWSEEAVCELYFDKFISFVRTFLSSPGLTRYNDDDDVLNQSDAYGRRYEDHYRIVIENETRADWESLVVLIKKSFVRYPTEIGWKFDGDNGRRPATATQGNVLEAINVTLNLLQFHYLDRDLQRTGNSIVVVSPGNGVFEVDRGLAGITYQRMMDNGIGSDMLSLGLPPLHIAPFFLYIPTDAQNETDASDAYYEVPHWMHLSFVSYQSETIASKEVPGSPAFNHPAGIMVGPNGFIFRRPRAVRSDASRLIQSAGSFSAEGNLAASPKRVPPRLTQERQLIEGRDFRDILEACRPRHSGMMPAALKSLLATFEVSERKMEPLVELSIKPEQEAQPLAEWGAMNFERLGEGALTSRNLSPKRISSSGSLSRSLGASPPRVELAIRPSSLSSVKSMAHSPSLRIGSVERLSEGEHPNSPSSYGSFSEILGVSYDRPFLAHRVHAKIGGVQLQRAPSLELRLRDVSEASEVASSDASIESADDDSVEKQRARSIIESIAQAMDSCDEELATRPMSHLSTGKDTVAPRTTAESFHRDTRSLPQNPKARNETSSTGGIGAALSNFTPTTTTLTSSREEDAPRANLRGSGTTRATLAYSVSPGLARVAEAVDRGLPPSALLPSAHDTNDSPDVVQGSSYERRGYLQRRLIYPQDVFRTQGGTSYSGSRLPEPFYIRPSQNTERALLKGRRDSLSKNSRDSDAMITTFSPPMSSGGLVHRFKSEGSKASSTRSGGRDGGGGRARSHISSRRKQAFNPFRQQDEDEVLAKKSHNRRRWSHVFPLGEVEFKRHAGPNWKSLTSPAILPLTIDYFPHQQEIDHNYTFSPGNIDLKNFPKSPYASNEELLMEMVRQRITQDYQVVPPAYVNASNYRHQQVRKDLAGRSAFSGMTAADDSEAIYKFLSMGHLLHVLRYDLASDVIEVTRYELKAASLDVKGNSFKYAYLSYCDESGSYKKIVQTFKKYSDQYHWTKVDGIICGDENREMQDGMRFRRIMFVVIPDQFIDVEGEKAYAAKFERLLEYFNKQREKDDAKGDLRVRIVLTRERRSSDADRYYSTPGVERSSMERFYIQLGKGKRDRNEWIEVAVDSTFDTKWTYRIMFNWLIAGSSKVEAQIQLLQRRCTQYGLNLVPAPQVTVAKNVYLNPFKAPATFTVTDKAKAAVIDRTLSEIGYVHDGVFLTDALSVTECLRDGHLFNFGRCGSERPGRQFMHRSGSLFVRILTDLQGMAVIVVLGNYRYMAKDESVRPKAASAFASLVDAISNLKVPEEEGELEMEKNLQSDDDGSLHETIDSHDVLQSDIDDPKTGLANQMIERANVASAQAGSLQQAALKSRSAHEREDSDRGGDGCKL